MTCIYCDGRRQDPEMSLEHIWPQALGGQWSPPLFRTNSVCRSCNSNCGLWVDGAFLKSWFISHEVSNAARENLDPVNPGIVPLKFMGHDKRFPVQDGDVAELWMGPGGDSVHHVHKVDDEKWFGIAGGDMIRRRKADVGRAYLMLRSESPYWLACSVKSFVAYMSPARMLTATLMPNVTGPVMQKLTPESDATDIEKAELAWVRGEDNDGLHATSFSHRLDFSRRFLAKIALGLGYTLFGEPFLSRPYTSELRAALWPRDENDGQIRGTDFFNETALQGHRLNGIRGAWSLGFKAMPNSFGLFLTTPAGRFMAIQIADDPTLWSAPEFAPYHHGLFYFVVPGRSYFSPPVSFLEFVGHQGGRRPNATLTEIDAFRIDHTQLPPLR